MHAYADTVLHLTYPWQGKSLKSKGTLSLCQLSRCLFSTPVLVQEHNNYTMT